MSKNEKIAKAVKDLRMEHEVIFSVKDIDDISRIAKVSTFDVMWYLRHERDR